MSNISLLLCRWKTVSVHKEPVELLVLSSSLVSVFSIHYCTRLQATVLPCSVCSEPRILRLFTYSFCRTYVSGCFPSEQAYLYI